MAAVAAEMLSLEIINQVYAFALAQLDGLGGLVPDDLKPSQTSHGADGKIGAAVVGDRIEPGAAGILEHLGLAVQRDSFFFMLYSSCFSNVVLQEGVLFR